METEIHMQESDSKESIFYHRKDGDIIIFEKREIEKEKWVRDKDLYEQLFFAKDIARLYSGHEQGAFSVIDTEFQEKSNRKKVRAIMSDVSCFYEVFWYEKNNEITFYDQIALPMKKICKKWIKWVEVVK